MARRAAERGPSLADQLGWAAAVPVPATRKSPRKRTPKPPLPARPVEAPAGRKPNAPVTRECRICGAAFWPKSNAGTLCSDPCRAEHKRRVARARRAKTRVLHTITCGGCGTTFKSGFSRAKFCCRVCHDTADWRVYVQGKRISEIERRAE